MKNRKLIIRRQRRVRLKIAKRGLVPRLSVFRSHRYIYAQIIDDKIGHTLVSARSQDVNEPIETKSETPKGKTADAYNVGKLITKKALDKQITKVVFDRGSYHYHGRVKALAEGARKAGLIF